MAPLRMTGQFHGATELFEGGPEPKRIVIIEFADAEAAKALVRFAGVPETSADPARQLDLPRLHRRRRELNNPRHPIRPCRASDLPPLEKVRVREIPSADRLRPLD
jgi:hypothetical protein